MSNYEATGIIGMIFILIAFSLKEERKIRLFDMIGAAFFVLYGAITNTFSTLALNAILILINFIRLYWKKD